MIHLGKISKLLTAHFFYRWHPEVALRYLPIVADVRKAERELAILEVGSGGLGIVPYLGRKVTGVDVDFQPPFHPLLERVEASALELPFVDSSFDIVISVDVLEHLKKKDRAKAVDEMIRVARKKVYIAVPCGKESEQQDLFLANLYQDRFNKPFPFLEEHLKYGLPEKDEIAKMIFTVASKSNKSIRLEIAGIENIHVHKFLMKGWITKSILSDFFFRKVLLLAVPLFRLMNRKPTYRQLFSVTFI